MFSQFVGPPQPVLPRPASVSCSGGLNMWPATVGSAEREAPGVLQEEYEGLGKSTVSAPRTQRRLTTRSSGAPTAGHQVRSVVRYILHSPGLASCRRRPLSSNVRHQTDIVWCSSRKCACRRE